MLQWQPQRALAPIALAFSFLAAGAGQAQETPKYGGVLEYNIPGEPATFDCHAIASFQTLFYVAPNYSSLLRYKPDDYPTITGDLAESWTVAPDGLSYTFKLRPNVVFHDGSPFSSEDIKATYERLRNPPEGVVSVRKSYFADIASIETPDPLTVVFKMARPNSSMLTVFASPWNCIYSAKKLAADQKYPATNVMGTGPFQFVEYRKGSDWTAKKFDRYFIKGLPYLDGLKAYPLLGAGRTNALVGGQVEADFHMFSPAESKRIKDERGDKTNLQSVVAIGLHLIAYNTTKKPLDDVRVRQALNLAIDRWTGIEKLQQITFEKAAGGLLRPGYELATPTAELEKLPGLSRDINASRAEAKRLLAEAGVQNLKLNLLVRQVEGPNLSIYLIDQWKQIGVNVELVLADDPLFFGQLSGATFDMVIDNMVESADDPVIMLVKYISDSPRNNTRSKDPVIDDLYAKIKQTLDKQQQRGLIAALEKRVIEQAYQVPLYWSQRTVVLASNIHGYHLTPSFYVNHDLLTVWKD